MKLITTECVSKGHPDKIADQISDAILDRILMADPNAKVAVETMVKDNCVVLGGEIKTTAQVDYHKIVQDVAEAIGYTDPNHGFYYKNLTLINLIGKQSPEINQAVEQEETGAGDQGFMVGYACNSNDAYMPDGMYLARKLVQITEDVGYGPDIKTQVTIDQDSGLVHSVLVSTMHPGADLQNVRDRITDAIQKELGLDSDVKIYVNPAGSWTVGGPVSDCGLTGRKIVVDQYGPYCPIGGGAYSGKDGTKVDRSAAYLARFIAKNVVAAGLASECKVEIAYMIGVAEPVSLSVEMQPRSTNDALVEAIRQTFPMTPDEIINAFDLRNPQSFGGYLSTARDGHYGNGKFPWEQTDIFADLLKKKYHAILERGTSVTN